MIDSNETLAYQNGRESGYSYGYYDGVLEFAEYLKVNAFLCDTHDSWGFQAIDVDDLDDMVKDFLRTL